MIWFYADSGHRASPSLFADCRSDPVADYGRRVFSWESSSRRTRTGQAIRRLTTIHAGSADCFGGRRIVDVRPGSGILVTTPESETPDISGDEGPLEILRVRSLIEGAIAAEVAPDMEQKDIDALEKILLAMQDETTAQGRLAADRQFHHFIAAKLDNKVLLRLLTGLLNRPTGLGLDSLPSILTMPILGPQFSLNIGKSWRLSRPATQSGHAKRCATI